MVRSRRPRGWWPHAVWLLRHAGWQRATSVPKTPPEPSVGWAWRGLCLPGRAHPWPQQLPFLRRGRCATAGAAPAPGGARCCAAVGAGGAAPRAARPPLIHTEGVGGSPRTPRQRLAPLQLLASPCPCQQLGRSEPRCPPLSLGSRWLGGLWSVLGGPWRGGSLPKMCLAGWKQTCWLGGGSGFRRGKGQTACGGVLLEASCLLEPCSGSWTPPGLNRGNWSAAPRAPQGCL